MGEQGGRGADRISTGTQCARGKKANAATGSRGSQARFPAAPEDSNTARIRKLPRSALPANALQRARVPGIPVDGSGMEAGMTHAAQISLNARWKFLPRIKPIFSRLYPRRTKPSVKSKIFLG